jgi:spore coat assembly protein SafA
MKKKLIALITVFCLLTPAAQVFADTTYTVRSGDTMWKIAQKHQVGISEIISKNPQVKNPALIYPGQKLTQIWSEQSGACRHCRQIGSFPGAQGTNHRT